MNTASIILGKYAIIQHDVTAQKAERRQTQLDKHDFFSRFSQPQSLISVEEVQGISTTETDKLVRLTEGSQGVLYEAKTVFPFVLFADTLKIDRQKITIVHNDFYGKSQTASTEIKNVMNIQANTGPIFGAITITSKHFLNNTQTIKYLRRGDVAIAQRLLQGFIIAQRAKINTDNIEKGQLLLLLNDLGQEHQK